MLALQDKMNTKVNTAWLTAGYGYLRAAMVESVEAIEHHGWKWWKAQTKDLPQLQMELVDIWHFALSHYLIEFAGDHEVSATHIAQQMANATNQVNFDGKTYQYTSMSLLDNLELMAGLCAAKRFDAGLFFTIAEQSELNAEALYCQYVGKNVLNFFRQDNGYKEGTYVKVWNGKEDNEYLVDLLAQLDVQADNFSDLIYRGLAQHYPA